MGRKTFMTACGAIAAFAGASTVTIGGIATAQNSETIILVAAGFATIAAGFGAVYAFLEKTRTPEG